LHGIMVESSLSRERATVVIKTRAFSVVHRDIGIYIFYYIINFVMSANGKDCGEIMGLGPCPLKDGRVTFLLFIAGLAAVASLVVAAAATE